MRNISSAHFSDNMELKMRLIDTTRSSLGDDSYRAVMNVLVIDDHVAVGKSIQMALAPDGVRVTSVHDGQTGMDLALVQPPDLILLDIGLPGVSGFEICRRLKKEPTLRAVPIIFISGWGDDETRRSAQQAGGDFLLVKPFKMEELRRILRIVQPPSGDQLDKSLNRMKKSVTKVR